MKKVLLNLLISFCFIALNTQTAYCDNISKAESLIQKAKIAKIQEESYEYLNKAVSLLKDEYDNNPLNQRVILDLSKAYQMLEDRPEAKLYAFKAYNFDPNNPKLQKAMGDFYYSFQEYSTAVEYYKLALASGLLKNYETNLQTAKCFEKLGDAQNAELYYKIALQLNAKSKEAMVKINEYESSHHADNSQELEEAKYKYLFKDKPHSEEEKTEEMTEELIESINSL